MAEKSFTGVSRRRTTRLSVKIIDRVSRTLITVGGIGTILAVLLIMFFLVWVVLPLFGSADIEEGQVTPLTTSASPAIRVGSDEYKVMGWVLREDFTLDVFRTDTGERIETRKPFGDRVPTAFAFAEGSSDVAFGYGNGEVRLGTLAFTTRFLTESEVPEDLRGIEPGKPALLGGGMVQRTPEGQFRVQTLALELEKSTAIDPPAPITRLDLTMTASGSVFAALTKDGRILIERVTERHNLLTGKVTIRLSGGEVPYEPPPGKGPPDHLLLSDRASFLYLVWNDGELTQYNTRDLEAPELSESARLLPEGDATVTAVRFMSGKTTLLVGDSTGRTRAWFPVQAASEETLNRSGLVMAHELSGDGSPVLSIAPSERSKLFAVGHQSGAIELFYLTTATRVAATKTDEPAIALAFSPKEDGLLASSPKALISYRLVADHPDITLGAMLGEVWYEGYESPSHVWQSTGGTDDFEPKLGLMPLIFGTLKATVYSMLFGLPLALFAAIFASEFLHPRVKARVKPTIEVMASLPSVVLGFLAALVIAPFVEGVIPTVLVSFMTIPLAFLGGAYLWQLLPQDLTIRRRALRFPMMFLCVPVGVGLAALIGPAAEKILFAGDIKMWLDGQGGSAFGGWFFLMLPCSAFLVALLLGRGLGGVIAGATAGWGRTASAGLDIGRFGVGGVLTLVLAVMIGFALTKAGLDPRGSLVGTYVQRNALIVGFVMGFAIIPIIFTIAEDALAAVPDHLRSASLGAGATPWQTATRIVIPTAMSGLFSAVMIGLGRAVGETMVVLMAAGNTPIMDVNIFNGFRTLAANLAVELPEAVKDSTHYRVLFFAALALFAMTFVVNTVAEIVRLRFRKRAFEL